VSPEEFPAFAEEILKRIRELENKWDIIPGDEAKTLDINLVVDLSGLERPEPPETPDTNETSGYLRTIIDWLRRIWEAIKEVPTTIVDWLRRIWEAIKELPELIGKAVIGEGEIDLSPLEETPKLSGFFPFSIPWDLKNAFFAIFAGSGATAEAPIIVIDMSDTVLNYRGEINFKEFEPVAQVVRWFLMSALIIGLITATSKLIKW
jgi:hypothetical protein